MHHKEQNPLQDIDNGEYVGNDWANHLPDAFNHKKTEAPRAAQDKQLSNGFKRHDSEKGKE